MGKDIYGFGGDSGLLERRGPMVACSAACKDWSKKVLKLSAPQPEAAEADGCLRTHGVSGGMPDSQLDR